MKSSKLNYLLMILLILPSGCQKDYDYINKYIGSWDFKYIWSKKEYLGPGMSDSSFYIGAINPGSSHG